MNVFEPLLDTGTLTYHPDGSTSIVYRDDRGTVVRTVNEKARMPDPDGPLHFFDVSPDDNTPWGLWKKARNAFANKALSLRGKKLKGMAK